MLHISKQIEMGKILATSDVTYTSAYVPNLTFYSILSQSYLDRLLGKTLLCCLMCFSRLFVARLD